MGKNHNHIQKRYSRTAHFQIDRGDLMGRRDLRRPQRSPQGGGRTVNVNTFPRLFTIVD